jgi:hypothetical protein
MIEAANGHGDSWSLPDLAVSSVVIDLMRIFISLPAGAARRLLTARSVAGKPTAPLYGPLVTSVSLGQKPAHSLAGHTGWLRVLIAGAVPASVAIAIWVSNSLGIWSHLVNSLKGHLNCTNGKMGCLGPGLFLGVAVAVALPLLIGPLLRLAGVRPAWPVVVTGPVISLIVGHAYQRFFPGAALTLPILSLGLAASYAAAAFVTMPSDLRRWQAGVVIALIALLVLSLL